MSTQADRAWAALIAKVEAKGKAYGEQRAEYVEKYQRAPTIYCRRSFRFSPLKHIAHRENR